MLHRCVAQRACSIICRPCCCNGTTLPFWACRGKAWASCQNDAPVQHAEEHKSNQWAHWAGTTFPPLKDGFSSMNCGTRRFTPCHVSVSLESQYLVRKYFSARPVPVQNDFASWSLTWSRLSLTQAQAPLRFFSEFATIKRIVMQTRHPHRLRAGFGVSVT